MYNRRQGGRGKTRLRRVVGDHFPFKRPYRLSSASPFVTCIDLVSKLVTIVLSHSQSINCSLQMNCTRRFEANKSTLQTTALVAIIELVVL